MNNKKDAHDHHRRYKNTSDGTSLFSGTLNKLQHSKDVDDNDCSYKNNKCDGASVCSGTYQPQYSSIDSERNFITTRIKTEQNWNDYQTYECSKDNSKDKDLSENEVHSNEGYSSIREYSETASFLARPNDYSIYEQNERNLKKENFINEFGYGSSYPAVRSVGTNVAMISPTIQQYRNLLDKYESLAKTHLATVKQKDELKKKLILKDVEIEKDKYNMMSVKQELETLKEEHAILKEDFQNSHLTEEDSHKITCMVQYALSEAKSHYKTKGVEPKETPKPPVVGLKYNLITKISDLVEKFKENLDDEDEA